MATYNYTPASQPNYALLKSEFETAEPSAPAIESFGWDGTTLTILTTTALSAGEETSLTNTVSAHDPEPLDFLRGRLAGQARDYFTGQLNLGCSHDSHVFSESAQAQAQWTYLKDHSGDQTYPYDLPTVTGVKYNCVDATALLVVVDAVIACVQAKTEAFRDATHDIVTAVDKTAAQAAYDAYAV